MALAHPLSAPVMPMSDISPLWVPELSWCLTKFAPFNSLGCYNDSGSDSALIMRSAADQYAMTVEECWAICKGNADHYAGLTYGGVCYCGPSINSEAYPVPDDYCNMTCSGNSNEKCGDNGYINIYEDTTFPSTLGLTTKDYQPIGCWADNGLSSGRALGYFQEQLSSSALTTEMCLQACLDAGFPYAGTEYAGQCFCGVVKNSETYQIGNGNCTTACSGNPNEMCGGGGAINIYESPVYFEDLDPPTSANKHSEASDEHLPAPATTLHHTEASDEHVSTSTTTTLHHTQAPERARINPRHHPPLHRSPPTSTYQPPPPPNTTPKPPTTTPKPPPSTTTGSICTTTITIPPKCEYKCGEKFCSNPLNDWDDEKGCMDAHSSCKMQVLGCFKVAGWPNAMDCFNFHEWCNTIKYYCKKKNYYGEEFGKEHCYHNYPPVGYPPHSTTTSTYPPSNDKYGYNEQKPYGNIHLPVLDCNNLESEHRAGDILKLYSHQDSSNCSSWKRQHCPDACEAACKQQYDSCKNTYARGCHNDGKDEHNNEYGKGYPGHRKHHGGGPGKGPGKHPGKGGYGGGKGGHGGGKGGGGHHGGDGGYGGGKSGKGGYFEYAADAGHVAALEARTHERWKTDGNHAEEGCTQQYRECVAINRDVKLPKDKCTKYGIF
ncbi:wsc domain-containing protein [Apiospora arundinis]